MIKLIVGGLALAGLGFVGYKRWYGTSDTFTCAGSTPPSTPFYLPTPKYVCGATAAGSTIASMQYVAGEWVYTLANGTTVKESVMTPLSGAVRAAGPRARLAGATASSRAVRVL